MLEPRDNTFDCIQGSPEWLKLRAGHVTSSRVSAIWPDGYLLRKSKGKEKGKETQARADYRLELACERLSHECVDHYVSVWMKEGREKEPLARAAYEIETGQMTDQVGFVLHPEIRWCGMSPDALIGDKGMAEFKCPKIRTHMDYLLAGVVPEEYKPQMYLQLACEPEREWNDFISFCPKLPKPYRTFICRLPRDNNVISEMEAEIKKFLMEVEDEIIRLREKYENGPTLEEVRLGQSVIAINAKRNRDDVLLSQLREEGIVVP
jgi:YqaJ-like viral recombinase domain